MSFATTFSRCLGIARINTELPAAQTQQTPSLPNTAVLPLDAPARRRPRTDSTMPPRAAAPVRRPESAAGGVANAGPARGIEGTRPAHVLLDSLSQAIPDHARLTRALFEPTAQVFGAAADLAFELARVDLSGVPPTPGLPGAPAVLLAQALAAATGGKAQLGLMALEALRELHPQQEIITAWQQRGAGPHDQTRSLHRTTAESAASEDGRSLSAVPPESSASSPHAQGAAEPNPASVDAAGNASMVARRAAWQVATALAATPSGMDVLQAVVAHPIEASRRRDFELLLKAAAAVPPGVAAGADPATILASDTAHATLPGQAVACAAARMAGDVEAARPHQWALGAVHNDLFDTRPGSDFATINARLMKMGRWVERATPERARRLRNPIFGKSPFRALRHGVQKVDRGPAIARHRLARETALREAATALKDRLIEAAPGMRTPGPGQAPEVLLRAAVLDHCLQTPAPQPLERARFDEDARADIAERLAHMLSPASGAEETASLAHRLSEMPELRALADVRLDAETLAQWFSQAREASGGDGVEATDAADEAPWVQAVSNGLARATEAVEGRDTRVPVVNRDTVRGALKDIIANIEGSSRLRLSSGGIVGVGLRQVTATISALASAFFLRGRLDARAQRGRQAVFEIAMPPYDMEIVLGTQRQVAGQLGVGAFVGPDIGIAKAGVNVDALLYGKESADIEGISLRLPRIGRPVPELRAEFSTLVDALLDGSEGGEDTGEEAPLLQRLLQDFPELTVNRIGSAGDGRRRHGVGADIAGSIGKWFAKASASVGGFVEAQRDVTKHYADATGRMRVERSIVGNAARAGGGIKASIGASDTLASHTAASGKVDLSIAALPVGVSAERILSGMFDRREAVYEDGRLHPLSFVETEYHDVQAFLASMAPQIDAWVDAGVDRARLDELLEDIRQHAAPTHSFATRFTVTPETRARDDVYRSALQLCAQHPSGLTEAVSAFESAIEAQWKDPAAVQPYSLRSYERNMVQTTQGVELVMQLASLDAAEASHIDNRLDVPAQRPAQSAPQLRPQPPQTTPEITSSGARNASASSSHGSMRLGPQQPATERPIPYAEPLPVAVPVDVTPEALASVPMAELGPQLQARSREALPVAMPIDLAAVPMAELADLPASHRASAPGVLPVAEPLDEAGMTPEERAAVPMAELYPMPGSAASTESPR